MDVYGQRKEKLKNRETIIIANVMLAQSPLLLRALERADFVLLDKEHGLYGTEELVPMLMKCRELKLPSIVRVEDALYHLIAKSIDMGADGIMLPRAETVGQVRTAVEAMHMYPIGRTGFGGWGIQREGESLEEFQSGRFLFPQIESPKGLAAMEDMLTAYGEYIDGFIIGPNDYSIMMGVPRRLDHPIMLKEYEKFFEICRRHGKSCGIYDPDLTYARRDCRMGANIFWLGDDFSYMKQGFEMLAEGVRAMTDEAAE